MLMESALFLSVVWCFLFGLDCETDPELIDLHEGLSKDEIHHISILLDQLRILEGQFTCDYGIFSEEIKCLGLQSNVVIHNSTVYEVTEGTLLGVMFENSDGSIAKLRDYKSKPYFHDGNFTYKEIGDRYYFITQEPSISKEVRDCLNMGGTWTQYGQEEPFCQENNYEK